MNGNKFKLLILTGVMVISLMSFGMSSNKNATETPSNPNITDTNKKADLSISKAELDIVAEKIFKNEAGGKKIDLVYWNTGEDFPSLGIGHFIWYKQGQRGRFLESFPQLVAYYKSRNIKMPEIMEENVYSPWESREELFELRDAGNEDIAELINSAISLSPEFLNSKSSSLLFHGEYSFSSIIFGNFIL